MVAVTPLPKAPSLVLGVIDFGGVVVPVLNVRERFRLPPRQPVLSDQLIVARTSRRLVALAVEATSGVIAEAAEDRAPAGSILSGLELVEGALKCASGLILIHDLDRLLLLEEEDQLDRALLHEAGAEGSPP